MTRNTYIAITFTALLTLCNLLFAEELRQTISFSPADKAKEVNPDTHLVLIFPGKPTLGKSGQIRIYDTTDNRLIDLLDMNIPPGPTDSNKTTPPYTAIPYEYTSGHFTNANTKPGTPSGTALATPNNYQLTIIGGFTDAFHFYPVIIHDTAATIRSAVWLR